MNLLGLFRERPLRFGERADEQVGAGGERRSGREDIVHQHHPAALQAQVQALEETEGEVLGGTWDALVSNRADLAIGVSGEVPSGGGFTVRPIGTMESMAFRPVPETAW